MSESEIVGMIVAWHIDRNLIEGATDESQFKKLMSEFGELSDNLAKGRCIKDDVGDMAVVLINIAERNESIGLMLKNGTTYYGSSYFTVMQELECLGMTIYEESKSMYKAAIAECIVDLWECLKSFCDGHNLNFVECLSIAYDDIKDRKGKMINGTFVKESDL